MSRRCGLGERREHHTRMGHFAGHGFMSEIQTQPVLTRVADDPGQKRRGWEKVEIREFCIVCGIPKNTGARTTFDIRSLGVDSKRRAASYDYTRHRHTRRKERIAQAPDGFKGEVTGSGAFGEIALDEVAVIGVESPAAESRRGMNLMRKFRGCVPRGDASAGLANVQVDE